MRIFMTGATGLIGRRLLLSRIERGDSVIVLSRNGAKAAALFAADANPNVIVVEGDPVQPGNWQGQIDGCDAVINLAGAGIADARWSDSYKKELEHSRFASTRNVVDAITAASKPPHILISGSAIGYYGDTGDRPTDESHMPTDPDLFLSQLCQQWEAEALRARDIAAARVVLLRTGVVLDERGGALPTIMKPLRWWVGGPLGSGRQYMSWIHWRDMMGVIDLALRDRSLSGPVNCVAPGGLPNRAFMKELGQVMHRPSWLPAPGFALRLVLGEFARSLLMSQRIVPAVALAHGYEFLFPELKGALQSLLGQDDNDDDPNAARTSSRADSAARSGAESGVESDGLLALDNAVLRPLDVMRLRPRRERPIAPIRLIAVDVDGTLLLSNGRMSQAVRDACTQAQKSGCILVPATARPPRSMRSIVQELGVSGPMINYNGAVVWDIASRTALHHQPLDGTLVAEIMADARAVEPATVVSLEVLDRWFTDRVDAGLPTETSRVFEPDFIGELDEMLSRPVTKLMLLAPNGRIEPVFEMVRERYWQPGRVAVFITDPHVIQICHPEVDKARALAAIARDLQIEQDECMAIGDGWNDAGMLAWAGFSIALQHAHESLHELADQSAPTNEHNGVAIAIQRYVLNAR
ncbi:MAG: TIGR01777 family oxidoreductase [Phycisphaerales bacterium]